MRQQVEGFCFLVDSWMVTFFEDYYAFPVTRMAPIQDYMGARSNRSTCQWISCSSTSPQPPPIRIWGRHLRVHPSGRSWTSTCRSSCGDRRVRERRDRDTRRYDQRAGAPFIGEWRCRIRRSVGSRTSVPSACSGRAWAVGVVLFSVARALLTWPTLSTYGVDPWVFPGNRRDHGAALRRGSGADSEDHSVIPHGTLVTCHRMGSPRGGDVLAPYIYI